MRAIQTVLRQSACVILFAACAAVQTQVTLSTAVTPSSGQPGVTSITLTGSEFPAGADPTGLRDHQFVPRRGRHGCYDSRPAARYPPPGRRNHQPRGLHSSRYDYRFRAYVLPLSPFLAPLPPEPLSSAPIKVPLTVNPGPSITSVTPNSAQLGQTVQVTLTATLTNFVQGATVASSEPASQSRWPPTVNPESSPSSTQPQGPFWSSQIPLQHPDPAM